MSLPEGPEHSSDNLNNGECEANVPEETLEISLEPSSKVISVRPLSDLTDNPQLVDFTLHSNNSIENGDSSDAVGGQEEKKHANEPQKNLVPFIGLVNHGSTCYLNSLLQTLFMTPEFRNIAYSWTFSDKGQNSIPHEIQKIFLLLQTSTKPAVETKSLTKSFGWNGSQLFQQHDVQELWRVMFEALEKSFDNDEEVRKVKNLYEGEMVDYVRCLGCNTIKTRKDYFQDLALAVRPLGEDQPKFRTLEDTLNYYVEPEILDGANQYNCSNCNRTCDAQKGLFFTKFPYLLTIQLKRFDYDYKFMTRNKLNDRILFPQLMNLNSMINDRSPLARYIVRMMAGELLGSPPPLDPALLTRHLNAQNNNHSSASSDTMGLGDTSFSNTPKNGSNTSDPNSVTSGDSTGSSTDTTDSTIPSDVSSDGTLIANDNTLNAQSGLKLDDGMIVALPGSNNCYEDDNGNNKDATDHEQHPHVNGAAWDKVEPKMIGDGSMGPVIYELYSILIHTGAAGGGHYFAHIKSFDDGLWYCFDDKNVSQIEMTIKDAEFPSRHACGGFVDNSNAYMLMYRQLDPETNEVLCSKENMPEKIKALAVELNAKIENEVACPIVTKASNIEMVRLRVWCRRRPGFDVNSFDIPVPTSFKQQVVRIYTFADTPITDVMQDALDLLKVSVPLELCRLVKYNDETEKIECSYNGPKDGLLGEMLKEMFGKAACYNLLLEIRKPDEKFLLYSPDSFVGKVFHLDLSINDIIECQDVIGTLSQSMESFMQAISSTFRTCCDNMVLVIDRPNRIPYILENPLVSLVEEGCDRNTKFYIHDTSELEIPKSNDCFVGTNLYNLVSRLQYCVMIPIILPPLEMAFMQNEFNVDVNANANANSSDSDSGMDVVDQFLDSPQAGSSNDSFIESEEHDWFFSCNAAALLQAEGRRRVTVVIDSRASIRWLTSKIANLLGVQKCNLQLYTNFMGPDSDEREYDPASPAMTVLDLFEVNNTPVRVPNPNLELHAHEIPAAVPGETRGCVHLLDLRCEIPVGEPVKAPVVLNLRRDASVATLKKLAVDLFNKQYGLNLSYDKCRIRKKRWDHTTSVMPDCSPVSDYIRLSAHMWEAFLQEVPPGQKLYSKSPDHLFIFTRRYYPSTQTLDKYEEIFIPNGTQEELQAFICNMSSIPLEFLEMALGASPYPCTVTPYLLRTSLLWSKPGSLPIPSWSEVVREDGHVVFYRDSREPEKTKDRIPSTYEKDASTAEKRASVLRPRKETGLKINIGGIETSSSDQQNTSPNICNADSTNGNLDMDICPTVGDVIPVTNIGGDVPGGEAELPEGAAAEPSKAVVRPMPRSREPALVISGRKR